MSSRRDARAKRIIIESDVIYQNRAEACYIYRGVYGCCKRNHSVSLSCYENCLLGPLFSRHGAACNTGVRVQLSDTYIFGAYGRIYTYN